MTLSAIGCMVCWMQTGIGLDLNIKPGEVFMCMDEQSGDLLLENGTDWFEEARSVPVELLRECPGWISKKMKDAEERGRQLKLEGKIRR